MTDFWTGEKSLSDSKPIELHEFTARGTEAVWRYADAPIDTVYGDHTFYARYISGDPIEQGTNALRNQTTVKTDWDCPYVQQYMVAAPEEVIDYKRYKGQDTGFITNFIGIVTAVRFLQDNREGQRHAEILIDPYSNDLRDSHLALLAGRQCQVPLYSPECSVARASFQIGGYIATISAATVTADVFAGWPVSWFAGGDFVASGGRAKIRQNIGTTIILSRPLPKVAAGDAFAAFAGCDHSCTTCQMKFNNLNNFRGQPLIPDGDPWQDSMT